MKSSIGRAVAVGWLQVVLILLLKYEVSHASTGQNLTHKTVGNATNLKKSQQLLNNTTNQPEELLSNLTTKDNVFESSGELDVEFESGSGEGSSSGESDVGAQIKLNGKRLHSISEAITKLLNSGRQRLESLKRGSFPNTNKASGPVVRAYVSDSKYDTKLHHKHTKHRNRRHPYGYNRLRRLNGLLGEDPLINPYAKTIDQPALQYSTPTEYRRPYYLYYPDTTPTRYDDIANPYQQQQQQYAENMRQNLLRNYALQQELAGKLNRLTY